MSTESGDHPVVPAEAPEPSTEVPVHLSEEEAPHGAFFYACLIIGWAVIVFGLHGMVANAGQTNPSALARILVGLNVVNDAVVIPLLVVAGFLSRRVLPRWALVPVQVGSDRLSHGPALCVSPARRLGSNGASRIQPLAVGLRAERGRRPRIDLACLCPPGPMVMATLATDALNEEAGPSRPTPARARGAQVTRLVVVVVAFVPIASYLAVALRQLGYPYELEWMEGGAVEIVARVVHGQAIYVAPSLHYVPYTYTPLYFWVSAAVAHLTGLSFLPLRLVSLTASVGCLAVLFGLVWRETDDPVAGVVASGFFAATFEVGGAWLDIGRVDSLFLLFLLLAVAAGRRARDWPGGVLVGLLVFAAFFTKQIGLVALAPILVYLLAVRRRVGIAALLTSVVAVTGSTLFLQSESHGWYGYYIYTELAHQAPDPRVWLHFLPGDIASPVGFAFLLAILGRGSGSGVASAPPGGASGAWSWSASSGPPSSPACTRAGARKYSSRPTPPWPSSAPSATTPSGEAASAVPPS